jgi:hypothetical protein
MAQTYREGDWFVVPLRRGGQALGLVARRPRRGTVVLGYFFGPARKRTPTAEELANVRAEHAQLVCRLKDTPLHHGAWQVIGHHEHWRRKDWPIPAFFRREGLSGKGIHIEYDGDNLTTPSREVPASVPEGALPEDVVLDEARVLESLMVILSEERPVTLDQSQWIR